MDLATHEYYLTTNIFQTTVVYLKGRKRWIVRRILEDKNYSYLDTLLDDVITIHHFELPDTIPRNIAQTQRPPKQEAIDAHVTRLVNMHQVNNYIHSKCQE